MQRVYILGTSGSGKTTLGRSLAAKLSADFIEIDSIYHQGDWRPLPIAEFREAVAARCAGEQWVADGNYSAVRDLVLARADVIVGLDYPKWLVIRRLLRRTLRRAWTREELWNGNRERFTSMFSRDPERNLLLWAWTTHAKRREQIAALMCDPAFGHTQRFRFTHPCQTEQWLASL